MKAKTFMKQIVSKQLRPPTPRKVLNAARKHGLRDSGGELAEWVGGYLTPGQRAEFRVPDAPVTEKHEPRRPFWELR